MIRNLHNSDATAVLDIYQQGLDSGEASFETDAPDWETWQFKYHPFCRLVCEQHAQVQGWAALAPVSARACYSGVAEVSVYVASHCVGEGTGSRLMAALVEGSEKNDIWSVATGFHVIDG